LPGFNEQSDQGGVLIIKLFVSGNVEYKQYCGN